MSPQMICPAFTATRAPFPTHYRLQQDAPDLIVFHTVLGATRPSTDPPGHHLADAIAKLTGLPAYAKENGSE